MFLNYQDWNNYSIFFSASYSQKYLKNCYQMQKLEQADQLSFQNCYPFIYYLEHGKLYYEQATKAPFIIQPVLLFYGYVHLLKACILTSEPHYPESTSVLAHGVSARKRKKQNYHFLEDEVKIQKTGLFPFITKKLFHMKHLEGEKVAMGDLLKYIPELSSLFWQLENRQTFIEIGYDKNSFLLPQQILDSFHMTINRFENYLQSKFNLPITIVSVDQKFMKCTVDLEKLHQAPFFFDISKKHFFFPLNNGSLFTFPEMLIHYLLLYNLSMIARYETEWWSELMKMMPNNDFPFIQCFLETNIKKGPYLIYQFLMRKIK